MSANTNNQSNNNFDFTQPNIMYENENLARCGAQFVENLNRNTVNENAESVISTIAGHSTISSNINANEIRTARRRRHKINSSQPIVDLVVALIALPTLIIFGLMLEANTRENWLDRPDNRLTVLGLGIGLSIVILIICGYVTHRMGVCLWTGPLPGDEEPTQDNYFNPHLNVNEMLDNMPPSYETVMGFDFPPPPYSSIVQMPLDEKEEDEEAKKTIGQAIGIQHI